MPTIRPLLPSSSFAFTAGIIGDTFLDYLCWFAAGLVFLIRSGTICAESPMRRVRTLPVSSALFARMQCTGCSARSRTRSGSAGLPPVGQQAGEFLQEPLIFIRHAASVFRGHLHSLRHTYRYQARSGGSGLTTAWWA